MRNLLGLTGLGLLLLGNVCDGQVTVQQPVVSRFGVSTTVSVPDRGTALLGGVSSYRASRQRYGFWPRVGSSFGREVGHTNVTASVRIHDLRAMDEYLLGREGGPVAPEAPAVTARGLLGGYGRVVTTPRAATGVASTTDAAADADAARAHRSYQLGLRAERAGKPGLAKLHFATAARNGSREARSHLQRIREPTP